MQQKPQPIFVFNKNIFYKIIKSLFIGYGYMTEGPG